MNHLQKQNHAYSTSHRIKFYDVLRVKFLSEPLTHVIQKNPVMYTESLLLYFTW